jgi:tetratricopeptide (TPR) repeat protein
MLMHTDQSARHEDRARLLLEADRHAEAFDEIMLAIQGRPEDVELRLLASDACERRGALPEAADHLARILAAEPEHVTANRRLAELLNELGDTHGAVRCWRRVVAATHEQECDAPTLLAIALSKDGQHEAAIDLFAELAHKHPLDGGTLANLGIAFLAAGREDEALEALTRGLALDPQSAEAHCGLGLTHHARGRWQDAAAAFRTTERLAPDSAVGSFNLALALDQLGDRDGARRALLRAAALEPQDEEVQSALEPLLVRPSWTPGIDSSRDGGASIQGDLGSFDLFNVLEFLRMQEKTGLLVVSAPAGVGMLRLERGMLIGGSAPHLQRLGEVLVRRGLISAEDLRRALSRQRQQYPGLSADGAEQDATTLGAVLLQERLLDEKQLTDVLFRMIVDVVGQIKQWSQGAFAFHSCADSGFPVRFNVQGVVLDLLRVEDEQGPRSGSTP